MTPYIHAAGHIAAALVVFVVFLPALVASVVRAAGWTEAQPEDFE